MPERIFISWLLTSGARMNGTVKISITTIVAIMSQTGAPNMRAYSRLNWEGLS